MIERVETRNRRRGSRPIRCCRRLRVGLSVALPCFVFAAVAGLPQAAGADVRVWDFETPQDAREWRIAGVAGVSVHDGRLVASGHEQVRLHVFPTAPIRARDCPYVRIRMGAATPRMIGVFWRTSSGETVMKVAGTRVRDAELHTWWVRLAGESGWEGEIREWGLALAGPPGLFALDRVELGPLSVMRYAADQWREFLHPRPLFLGTINALASPPLFGMSFVAWSNVVAGAVLGFFLLGCVQRRGRVAPRRLALTGMALLTLWVLVDVRETWEQSRTAERIRRSYVVPPPGEKTFPGLGDFYRFVALCRREIPSGAQYHFYSDPDWPYDCRIVHFLYPRRITSDTWVNILEDQPVPFHAVYRDGSVRYDPESRRLRRDGADGPAFVSGPGMITARHDAGSFVFCEEASP